MLRFKGRLRCAVAKRKQGQELQFPKEMKISPIDVDELWDAERAIIKLVQSQRSDKGRNFIKGEKELCEWNQLKIHGFLLAKGIKWTFKPPAKSPNVSTL